MKNNTLKRVGCILVAISIMAEINMGNLFTNNVSASEAPVVKLDGKIIEFPDIKPYINEDKRTMVPVRFITEAMGCKVDWEESNELVIITKAPKRIALKIGENSAIVNSGTSDERKVFDTKAVLAGNRTMVPLRFVSETLGAGVAWDEVNNTVIIRSDGVVEVIPTPKPTPVPTATPKPVPTPTPTPSPLKPGEKKIILGSNTKQEDVDSMPIIMQLANAFDGKINIVSNSKRPKDYIGMSFAEWQEYNEAYVGLISMDFTRYNGNPYYSIRISAAKYNEKTLSIIKKTLEIAYADYPDIQKAVYDGMIKCKESQKGEEIFVNDHELRFIYEPDTAALWENEGFGVTCFIDDTAR